MKRKTKIILTLSCAALSCLVLGACKKETELDRLDKEGNKISVTYDANGGKFMKRTGITIVDMFNPDHFTDTDGDGKIEISLKGTDPAVVSRIEAPEKDEYSFAGWFKTREPVVNGQGAPVDDFGNELELREDVYYIKGTDTVAEQAYSYSDRWDFNEDKLVYELGSGSYGITLYAAWVPYFRFNFYYKDEETHEWTLLAGQSFDYTATQRFADADYGYAPALKETAYNDYVWTPRWSGENDTGAMEHTFNRADGTVFTFPSFAGHTFRAAYADEGCTEKIDGELQHAGSFGYDKENEKLSWSGIDQNIYLEFDKGEQYRIATAKDFVSYAARSNETSVYTVMANELDFTGVAWPSALTSGEFAGRIVGNNAKFKNITAKNGNASSNYGGLFGTIGESASIENITFENISYDIDAGSTASGIRAAYYGVLAGSVESGAHIEGVSILNPTLIVGKLGQHDYQINLICGNGIPAGVTYEGAKIVLKSNGTDNDGKYLYFVTEVTVNEQNGAVVCKYVIGTNQADRRDSETYVAYPAP